MQRNLILLSLLIGLLALSACTPIAPPTQTPDSAAQAATPEPVSITREADVPRISLDEALVHFEEGTAVFMDSRGQDSYDVEHITGALPLPTVALSELGDSLDKDQLIITYCTWTNEASSASLAFKLYQNGYQQVAALKGGFGAWIDAGYPTE